MSGGGELVYFVISLLHNNAAAQQELNLSWGECP